MSVKIEGIEEVVERLEELSNTEQVEKTVEDCCQILVRSAVQNAKKGRTGDLRRSIKYEVDSNSEGIKGIVFTPLFYAPYVEYGTGLFAENGGRQDVPWCYQDDKGEWHSTSGMKPQPFMRPALNDNREHILRLLREAIKL